MQKISTPIEHIAGAYEIVVIGSGYGGSITASRMARAGRRVAILERGREISPGEYPTNIPQVMEESQIITETEDIGNRNAMFTYYLHQGMSALVGNGLGGTSLINANVAIKPDKRVVADHAWPKVLREEYEDPESLFRKGYDLSAKMLKPATLPDRYELNKIDGLKVSAKDMDEPLYRTDIYVNFDIAGPNKHGMIQEPCNLCGECCSGCNYNAKNTLLMNYLPDAVNHGAKIFTGATVKYVEKKGDKWLVHYHVSASGEQRFDAPTAFIEADIVVLSAGTLGSSEILLRSKAQGLSTSDRVGQHFSGNGDFIGFGFNSEHVINGVGYKGQKMPPPAPAAPGPCITSVIDMRDTEDVNDGIIIEDCSIPGSGAGILPELLGGTSLLMGADEVKNDNIWKRLVRWYREIVSLIFGPHTGSVKRTQGYLVMAHDRSAGVLELVKNRLNINYPNAGREEVFDYIDRQLRRATRAINGIYVKNPMWSKLMKEDLITVHPLGGCIMADDSADGVTNSQGQVYTGTDKQSVHENLYVADGSIVPRSLGVNPSWTISALSERNVFIMAKDRGWNIDYEVKQHPMLPQTPATVGVQFTEKMAGFFSFGITNDDYATAYSNGKEFDNSIEFILTIRADDLDKMIEEKEHEFNFTGTVIAPQLSDQPLSAVQGVFNLFTDDESNVGTKLMQYRMLLLSEEGQHYYFTGFKKMFQSSILKGWSQTSTLYATVYGGKDTSAPILGQGILHIKPKDFIKQMFTMKAVGTDHFFTKIRTLWTFFKFFGKSLFQEYGGVFIPNKYYDPEKPIPGRKLRLPDPESHPFKTEDGVDLLLTRYNGGEKGPIMMLHGFSGNRFTFSTGQIETNMAEFFYERGYDVWLFDYRLSNCLPSAHEEWTLDAVAEYDHPAAIKVIQDVAGVKEVDVIAHCVGSVTIFMSLMKGMKGVRSLVSAQIATDFWMWPPLRWKYQLHAGQIMLPLGIRQLTAYVTTKSSWFSKLLDIPLKFYAEPLAGVCTNPTCHRLTFMFGPLYEHANLTENLHKAQAELFKEANMESYQQLAMMFRHRVTVNYEQEDVYMSHFNRLKLPITFIHGEKNRVFQPQSTRRTYDRLCELFGNKNYARFVIKDYGHNDCMYGKHAHKDVYPHILAQFEQFN